MEITQRPGDCLSMQILSDVSDKIPCDLMIRRKADMYTPVVFFNKTLPSVLSCISRELSAHHAEQNLSLNLYGVITAGEPGPLSAWYQSILQNIYYARPPHQPNAERGDLHTEAYYLHTKAFDLHTEAFYLHGEIFTPMDLSSYQYVTLTLPPLWQKNRNSADQNTGVSLLSRAAVCKAGTESSLFGFRYCQDTSTWYASQAGSKARSQACSKAGSQAGSQAGSKAGSHNLKKIIQ